VYRIEPASGRLVGLVEVDAGPSGVAIVGPEVWTANELAGTVSRIDPATEHATTVRLGSPPTAVAGGYDTVYVALRPNGLAHRGGTLMVAVPADIPLPTVDPTVGSFSPLFEFVRLTNDGLLAYRHVSGQAGSELVPDLAVSMPDVSADGKGYRFQLRPNVRYSNGDPVRAGDVRYTIERAFRVTPDAKYLFGGIRGAKDCGRRRCNLAAGVETDDAARTVTFNLTAPDPYFLYKLVSSSAVAVPTGTSLREAKRRRFRQQVPIGLPASPRARSGSSGIHTFASGRRPPSPWAFRTRSC
jgi:ABC-type transport system substrate-binding protein